MNTLFSTCLFLLVATTMRPSALAESPVQLLRLAIVDTSSSMTGPRIVVVKDELRRVLQQTPASPEFPFALVTFASTADKARVYTERDAARQAIDGLKPDGGTNIAAGLARGIEELRGFSDATHIAVLFYSDGEDGNLAGILAQETELDALFADRERTGLKQTVIFKRWGNANVALKQKIEERGRSRVVDAGDGSLASLRIKPDVRVADVRWSSSQPNMLDVDIVPTVTTHADIAKSWSGSLRFRCATSGASGDTTFDVDPNTVDAQKFTLTVPVSMSAGAKEMTLPFDVTVPKGLRPEDALLVPLLADSRVEAKLTVPQRQLRNIYTVKCDYPKPARWTDPLQLRAAFPMELHVDVKSLIPTNADNSATFRITPGTGTSILDGKTVFTIPGPGTYTVPLTLELSPTNPKAALHDLTFAFRLTLTAENVPPNVTFEPPQLDIDRSDLAAPSPIRTTISATMLSVGAAKWVDLAKAIAVMEAKIRVRVDGPLPPDSEFSLTTPPSMTRLELASTKLRSGEQTVTIRLTGKLPPAPRNLALSLSIVLPKGQGAIVPCASQPLTITLAGPAPVRLVVSNGHQVLVRLNTTVADNAEAISLSVIPVLTDVKSSQCDESLRATLASPDGRLQPTAATALRLFVPQQIQLQMPRRSDMPFFTDSVLSGYVEFRSSPVTPAIVGSRYPVDVTVIAPFKRLLFLFAMTLSPLAALILFAWLFAKFRQSDS